MHPFDFCRQEDLGETWALLYSGMQGQGSGDKSLLAYAPKRILQGGRFEDLQGGHWFGYAGYEMLHTLEDLPQQAPSPISLPAQYWFWPQQVLSFPQALAPSQVSQGNDVKVKALASNLTTARYLQIVRDTIAQIHTGAFYQANITRKFYGELERAPDAFTLFQRLCTISPSPYSAFLQLGDTAILSSSPEGFLEVQPSGRVITRPIKGSALPDDASLAESLKDRAENLMIVDLMRNDLSRSCDQVRVESLCDIHRFATITQMISTVSGQRRSHAGVLDVIKGCFPAGSMTGAPKIAAMRWCASQERLQRGVYSGALGWIDSQNNTADLSVVIRTLILQGNRFEFQVGGGIVADSDPQKELEETLLKARAICEVLGIDVTELSGL